MKRVPDTVKTEYGWPDTFIDAWERFLSPDFDEGNVDGPYLKVRRFMFHLDGLFPSGTTFRYADTSKPQGEMEFMYAFIGEGGTLHMSLRTGLSVYHKGVKASEVVMCRVGKMYTNQEDALRTPVLHAEKNDFILYRPYMVYFDEVLRPMYVEIERWTPVDGITRKTFKHTHLRYWNKKHYAPRMLDMVLRSIEGVRINPREAVFRVTFPKARVRIFVWDANAKTFTKYSEANPGVPMRIGPKENAFLQDYMYPAVMGML